MKTTETSKDDEHEEDVQFETLCKGEPSSSSSMARPKRRSPEKTVARAQSRTGRGRRRRRNGGCVSDNNDYERLTYIQ